MTTSPTIRSSASREWLRSLALTGAMALCAQVSFRLPYTPVPVTLQVFGVLLSGLLLGSRWAALAQAQYLAFGLMGLPVFAEMHSASALFGVTAGYLWSYPLAAFVVGLIAERGRRKTEATQARTASFAACAAGIGIIYGMGCGWLAVLSHPMLTFGQTLLAGAGWFVVWDAVKALAAIAVANGLGRR